MVPEVLEALCFLLVLVFQLPHQDLVDLEDLVDPVSHWARHLLDDPVVPGVPSLQEDLGNLEVLASQQARVILVNLAPPSVLSNLENRAFPQFLGYHTCLQGPEVPPSLASL